MMHYVLIERRVVECPDLLQWARWMELSRRDDSFRVAETTVGDYWVSTVFLGLDHRFVHAGPPVVFETMVFAQKGDYRSEESMERYCSYEEAERGHALVVQTLQTLLVDAELAASSVLMEMVRRGVAAAKQERGDAG